LCVLLVYLKHFGGHSLYPTSPLFKGLVNDAIFKLSLTMTSQSVVKHLLTEGDKIVLGSFSPLQDQGGYAIAVNYGSLVARIVFQPIEESSRVFFAKTLATTSPEALQTGSQALISLLSVQTSLSLIFLVFGSNYISIALRILLPPQYLATSAPRVLRAWVWYIPVLALNGGLEAFISSVSTPQDLNRQSRWMAAFSLVYISTAVGFYQSGMGDASLVYANIINLSTRIAYAVHFTTRFFANKGSRKVLRWQDALPGWKLSILCCVSAITVAIGRRLTVQGHETTLFSWRVMAYLGLGGVMGLICLGTWWMTEGRDIVARRRDIKSE